MVADWELAVDVESAFKISKLLMEAIGFHVVFDA